MAKSNLQGFNIDMQISTNYTLPKTQKNSFKARHIANVIVPLKSGNERIQLYSLACSDKPFLKKMAKRINLRKLYPGLKDYDGFSNWKNLIVNAVSRIESQETILAVSNKRPCGIMTYSQTPNGLLLSYLVKWRTKPNVDTPFVGKALMRNLFQNAVDNKSNWIKLTPAGCEPRGKNCRPFYYHLGFKEVNDGFMLQEKTPFQRICAQLDNYFEYKPVKDTKDVKLNRILSLTFNDSLWEKFLNKLKGNKI